MDKSVVKLRWLIHRDLDGAVASWREEKLPLDHFDPGALFVARNPATRLDRTDGSSARAFLALTHLVIHSLTFLETVKGSAHDLGVMEEQVVPLPLNKSESTL
jgi:hypothetical protein